MKESTSMFSSVHATRLLMRRVVEGGFNLVARLRDAFVEARQARIKLEAELFRGRYHLSSKNDDDLPIVR
jgi:hypothetical protein